jgi:hypothetical protein
VGGKRKDAAPWLAWQALAAGRNPKKGRIKWQLKRLSSFPWRLSEVCTPDQAILLGNGSNLINNQLITKINLIIVLQKEINTRLLELFCGKCVMLIISWVEISIFNPNSWHPLPR